MSDAFTISSLLMLAAAGASVLWRRPVHNVLLLTAVFAGLAVLFLQLGAEFVGFAQLLIYVGAVGILMVFALLLTRQGGAEPEVKRASGSAVVGIAVTSLVFGCLVLAILASDGLAPKPQPSTSDPREIGEALLTHYVLPLQVLGLLLTAVLIGAVLVAMEDDHGKGNPTP